MNGAFAQQMGVEFEVTIVPLTKGLSTLLRTAIIMMLVNFRDIIYRLTNTSAGEAAPLVTTIAMMFLAIFFLGRFLIRPLRHCNLRLRPLGPADGRDVRVISTSIRCQASRAAFWRDNADMTKPWTTTTRPSFVPLLLCYSRITK